MTDQDRLERIEAQQEEILDFLRGKVAMELESICQAVHAHAAHPQGDEASANGDGDGRVAEQS